MKKKSIALILSLLMMLALLCSCNAAPQKKEEKEYSGTYEEKIKAFYEDHKDTAAGMMVGVFDKNGTIYEGYYGYSNIAEGIKADENTVIDWGSTTKTMVWVSVMQLWERGKIDLEKDVREYLPEGFLTNLKYDKPVRMTDLMNHRAGFQEYYTDMFQRVGVKIKSLEETLKDDQPEQVFEPDTMTAYSNWGVALAAYIVERVSGQSFADYVHENIFEPLGMKDSALAPDLMDNKSVRERRDKLVCYSGTTPVGTAFYYIQLYPAGACVSTLRDYIKYGSCFVQDKFPLFEKQETFGVMMSATSYFAGTEVVRNAHGFWALPYGSNTFGHGGNTQACSSYITFDPGKQLGCVVMTNQAGESNFNDKMFELIYGKNAWSGLEAKDVKKGFYHPARTVLKGHFRVMGVGYATEDTFKEWFWTYNEKDGIPKIEHMYGDYYYVSPGHALFEVVLFYGWMVSLAFAVISLIVKGIRAIVRKAKKSTKKILLGKQTGFMSLLILLLGLLGLTIMMLVTMWFPKAAYIWAFSACGIVALILAALTAVSIVKFFKTPAKESSVIRKIYNIAAVLFAVINVIFVFYLDLWH